MKLRHIRLLALLAAIPLGACSDDDGNSPVDAADIRLLNAVTNAGSVHLRLDAGNITSTALAYNNSPSYLHVRSGQRVLSVRASDGTADLVSSNINLGTDQFHTVIFAGRNGASGTYAPRFITLQDNGTAPTTDHGAFRVVHASAGAPAAVDIYFLGTGEALATATPEYAGVDFAEVMTYANVPIGEYDIVVTAAGQKTALITEADVAVAKGDLNTLVVIGDPATTATAVLDVRILSDD